MSYFLEGTPTDLSYKLMRDDLRRSKEKLYIENLWELCKINDLLDSDHRIKAQNSFHDMFWELYLGATLVEKELSPKSLRNSYTDFFIEEGNNRIHIEAVAPNQGIGDDAISEPDYKGKIKCHDVPINQIKLRLTNAIDTKFNKWVSQYSKQENVTEQDHFVIAINGRAIHSIIQMLEPPIILNILFGFGHLSVPINNSELKPFHETQLEIKKRNDSEVETSYFLKEKHKQISGILFSTINCINYPDTLGDDFIFIHNPLAENRLPKEIFSKFTQYHMIKDTEHEGLWKVEPI